MGNEDIITTKEDDGKKKLSATPPPQPIGSLSVGGLTERVELSEVASSADAIKLLSKPTTRKPTAKKSSVKKLSSSDIEVKIDSFEAVERSAAKTKLEDDDLRFALKLSRELNDSSETSSGRVAAVMQDVEEQKSPVKASIYRAVPAPASSVFRAGSTKAGAQGSSESREAREKYANVKSLSSDQFFGNAEEDADMMRGKLDRLSSSKAISSDMLNGYGDSSFSSTGNGNSMDKLKDSVSGFFDDIQKRIG